jgi:hypothetical protein
MSDRVDKLAAEIYDYCCSHRGDNMKKGVPGNPRNVGSGFDTLFDEAKEFYRSIARWHLGWREKVTANQDLIWSEFGY